MLAIVREHTLPVVSSVPIFITQRAERRAVWSPASFTQKIKENLADLKSSGSWKCLPDAVTRSRLN